MCEKGVEGFRATPEPLCLWKEHWTRGRWLGFKSQVCCEPVRELGQVTFFSSGLHFPTWKNEEHALHQHSSYLLLQSKNVQDIDWFEAFPKFHHFMACHEMGGSGNWAGLSSRSSLPCGVIRHHSVSFGWSAECKTWSPHVWCFGKVAERPGSAGTVNWILCVWPLQCGVVRMTGLALWQLKPARESFPRDGR